MKPPRTQITFRLPQDVIDGAKEFADRMDRSVTELVELGLRREIGMEPQTGTSTPGIDLTGLEDRLARLERLAENSGAI